MKNLINRVVNGEATVEEYVKLAAAVVITYIILRVVLNVTGVVLGLVMDIVVHLAPIAVLGFVVYKVMNNKKQK